MKELPRHKQAFEDYYLQPKRSYNLLAKKFKVSITSIAKWSKAFQWNDRIIERDSRLKERVEEKTIEAISDMNLRHLKEFKFLQGKAIKTLQQREQFTKERDAITGLVEGIKGERTIRGQPTEQQEFNVILNIKRNPFGPKD